MVNVMKILTTGEVAKYCSVNFRTVIRWIEKGHLKAYKLPGRGNNRIKLPDFIQFLATHEMPIPPEFRQYLRRVLVVDDDLPMAKSIRRSLHTAGFMVETAHDGFKAGLKVMDFMPAVITLDLKMPGIDGFEVLDFIRRDPTLADIKILVISACPMIELQKALNAGADDILEKPFDVEELIHKINALLGQQSQPEPVAQSL